MAKEALDRKARFEDIYDQRNNVPELYAALQRDAHFTPRYPRPAFVDSATLGPDLDSSLEGKLRITPLEIGGRDFKTPITEIVESFAITGDHLTVKKTKEILEKVRKGSAQVSPESQQLLSELLEKEINISRYSLDRLRSPKFTTLPQTQHIEIADGKVGDLVPNPKGSYATTGEIDKVRDEKGLQPVLAETALHFLLQKGDQLKRGERIVMSMEPIADPYGDPRVFWVGRYGDGLWLHDDWADPGDGWNPDGRFAFGVRK